MYNYLSDNQKAQQQKEEAACQGSIACLVQTEAKWTAISGTQDIGLGVGVVAGIGLSGRRAMDEIAYLEPQQILDGVKAIISDPSIVKQIPEELFNSINDRYNFINQQMQVAGWDGSVKAGSAIGSLLFDVATAASGLEGGVKLTGEIPAAVRSVTGAVNDLGALVKGGGQVATVSDVPVATAIADAEAGGASKFLLTYASTSGVVLQAVPAQTTTILGSYANDMRYIIGELGNIKSIDFGSKNGGFNVLNVPDELYISSTQFWREYNQPWLSGAIDRGDSILMATKPDFGIGGSSPLIRVNPATGRSELSGFGREYLYLLKNGYKYDPVSRQMKKN